MSSATVLDNSLCQELSETIQVLTTDGNKRMDEGSMKKIKAICKKSDGYVNHVYHLLMHQLEKDHAEIRLPALIICNQLFQRSHVFRELLVSDFQSFMELTMGLDPENELPPPAEVAKVLKTEALRLVHEWYRTFGMAYKKLALGYEFLKDCKNIQFSDIDARSIAARNREAENKKRQQLINEQKLKSVQNEIADKLKEMKSCVEQMRNCIKLLRSSTDDVFDEDDFAQPCCSKSLPEEETNEMREMVKEHGLGSTSFSITVSVSKERKPFQVSSDNEDVLMNLKELKSMAVKFLATTNKWSQVAAKCSENSEELKTAIDMKNSLQSAIAKCSELGLGHLLQPGVDDDENSDDDFEEVPSKEGFEESVKAPLPVRRKEAESKSDKFKETPKDWKLKVEDEREEEIDPTSFKFNATRLEKAAREKGLIIDRSRGPRGEGTKEVDAAKKELLLRAPVIRLVEMAGVSVDTEAVTLKQDMGHRFWNSGQDYDRVKKGGVKLGRVLEVAASSDSNKWSCRAPLPSGKLCPRRDKIKCPLHGAIIPRDESGEAIREEDKRRLQAEKEKQQQENPDWQDPALLRDIEAATGIDLTIKKRGKTKQKGGKGKKAKYPHLTDLKASTSTARSRLKKKVFSKASVKRVADVMDSQDRRKFQDKFGNQFNYAWQE